MNHPAAATWMIRLRAVALGTLLVVLTTAQAVAMATGAVSRGPASFDELVLQAATTLTLVATAALDLIATTVLLDVWTDAPGAARSAGSAGTVRRVLLAACGASLAVAAVATPASADDSPAPPSIAGLPLPDRADGTARGPVREVRTVRVRAGDSLWTIAQRHTGPRASVADVASYWQRLQGLNQAALRGHPDLVRPGLRLDLPTHRTRSEP